ncbi:MAG: beta-lactamase family protein [Clostridiales bacterium]|nr:beta-lactamase family protein [Clostridiales bacterium]
MAFEKLTAYLDSLSQVGTPGCDLIVYRDHEQIYRHFSGFRNHEKTAPMQGNETFCIYSCSKVFTTCAMMQLIGDGKIGLDDPVSDYLPAYGAVNVQDGENVRPAQKVMTIRHLMSMQGGLDYDLNFAFREVEKEKPLSEATTREIMDAMAKKPLGFDPGTDYCYSLCHDVLGAVIEVVTGQKFSDYVQEHIFSPLGLKRIGYHLNGDLAGDMCPMYIYQPETNDHRLVAKVATAYPNAPLYESGGAGVISDVESCIRFADALSCQGKGWNGGEILNADLIHLWTGDQLCPKGLMAFDPVKRALGYKYGLGVRVRVDNTVGKKGPLTEFGWDGATGTWLFIDPVNHISAFYAQHVHNHAHAFRVIHPTLQQLIYEELGL